ncbi:geranylgeranyl diphosphate synthase, type I [Streptomyces sp. Ag82_O1-12]|uniref:polyprenyl synthetase family protein n=1 Tax=unclassified Streptomyces TaxID=2593676 RepID=UPI000BC95396|nr:MULTISPECIES: polyprenyl synthetase family protein [unclassified Streptomyces]SMQ18661.1 geranylgeranyl diphosphate synthase, type I [Streptomyces sp. Ag82_O1-12]SOD47700.1 geranylgeranyl diphosphate synthase, type I [Streptomyces sp. Ag82_G6-1]
MLGPRPTVAGPAEPNHAPLTAPEATRAMEAVLERVLEARLRQARDTDAVFAADMAERLAAYVRRGGKRLRTAFVWCGWRAAGGSGDASAVLRTGAALELLQACALIHDDVMDGSPLRRGAPAMHVDFAHEHPAGGSAEPPHGHPADHTGETPQPTHEHPTDHTGGTPESFGASAAVLVGDLALAWADDLLTETALASPQGPRLFEEWRAMRTEMVAGQYRDLRAQASGSSGAEEALTIAVLKSARYTVARPLALGASLAGADARTLGALRAAGRCAGLAFQLRDDLLGAFGDPALTGKPADEDLRARKLTPLLAVAVRLAETTGDRDAAAVLAPDADARPGHSVERMRAALERTGARAEVEARIADLAASGLRHFAATGAAPGVRREFATLVERASGVAPRQAEELV